MTLVLELTEEQKARLHHFAVSRGLSDEGALIQLVETLPEQTKAAPLSRIPGLNRGWIAYMAPDFDDPLPDEFWLGDEKNDPLYRK
jgi:hypothetical protein